MPIISQPGSASAGGTSALTRICDSLLVGSQATFDTNVILGGNIPATFKQLQFYLSGRGDSAVASVLVNMQLNGDTGATNYLEQWVLNNAPTTAAAGGSGGASSIFVMNMAAASATASYQSSATMTFYNYVDTTLFKSMIGQTSLASGTGAQTIYNIGATWLSAAAINRILLTPGSGNFVAGSRFTLYGLS